MRSPLGVIIFVALCILLDIYIFQSLRVVMRNNTEIAKTYVFYFYWGISAVSALVFLSLPFLHQRIIGKLAQSYLVSILFGIFIAKLLAVFIFLTDDLRRFVQWTFTRLFSTRAQAGISGLSNQGEVISRSVFMSWLGLAAGGTLFGSLLYGFTNKYNYRVIKKSISFKKLPPAFKGLKILQISDIHSGSFNDKQAVEKGIDLILKQNADIILFTGDLVNNMAVEMDEYKDLFSKLKAPLGVYSVLGNHDYGDYVIWPVDGLSKEQNLDNLKQVHKDMGWKLLVNEHVAIEKDGDSIALLGIENWSAKARFPKYGRMDLAYAGSEKYPFKILMSHDPSHWDTEVLTRYKDIDLTLSGHTHGMQFGVEIPGLKWSPVQYVYKKWAGHYKEGDQHLYVNRGFGFLGYPGRVGVLPEITVIEVV
jgi:predicted MPP superfamily phosphohydrolase